MNYTWRASLNFANKQKLMQKIGNCKREVENVKRIWPEVLVVVNQYEKMCEQVEFTSMDVSKIEKATKNIDGLKTAIEDFLGDMPVHGQDIKAHYQHNNS
jgi:hypothetical protein